MVCQDDLLKHGNVFGDQLVTIHIKIPHGARDEEVCPRDDGMQL